jgi:hypothetical protein
LNAEGVSDKAVASNTAAASSNRFRAQKRLGQAELNLTLPDDEPRLPDKVQCLAHQVHGLGKSPLRSIA